MTGMHRDQNREIKGETPPLMRVVGRDADTIEVLQKARDRGDPPVQFASDSRFTTGDYAKIDLALAIDREDDDDSGSVPDASLGYAGWTPRQRAKFLSWLCEVDADAPAAFQDLYLANLESRLFEGKEWRRLAQTEVRRLESAQAWRGHQGLARVDLLSFWLAQDGLLLTDWLAWKSVVGDLSDTLMAWGLGWQALLGEPLRAPQIIALAKLWRPTSAPPSMDALALQLDTLTASLGQEPLAYALAQLGDKARTLHPWRGVHRDVRLLLPRPDVLSELRPLIMEMTAVSPAEETPPIVETALTETASPAENSTSDYANTFVILEFGYSRSEYFSFVLELAQRNDAFTQIMDEDRKLVYRVTFQKGKIRNFWRLWEYVRLWSDVHVYVRGEEIDKMHVYPYSQFLR
jgi:hypothetical protein